MHLSNVQGIGFDRSPINLPLGLDLHNIHRLNSTHLFLVGGFSSLIHDGHPYFLEYETGTFTEASDMNEPRHAVFSGLVTGKIDYFLPAFSLINIVS